MNKFAVAVNIVHKLQENSITPKNMAKRLNVTNETFFRWINGERMPTAYALYRMAKIFNCTMEELMEGIENENFS